MDINKLIFSRKSIAVKIAAVNSLTDGETIAITAETLRRIIRETGTATYKRDKTLFLTSENRPGNDWNSTFEAVCTYKGHLIVEFYLQYGNTDTTLTERLDKFLSPGSYHGSYKGSDRYGNDRTYYFSYTPSQKAACLRSILLEYLQRKSKAKSVKIVSAS